MRRFFPLLALGLALMTSCKEDDPSSFQLNHFPSGDLPSSIGRNGGLMHVTGVNLINIDDYDFEAMMEHYVGPLHYGCSQVRKGDYVARNLDWYQLDVAVNIIRIGATENHLASLQVCGPDESLSHSDDVRQLSAEQLNNMLAYTVDGINSEGVYIGCNAAPYGEMSATGGDGAIHYTAPSDGVNADKPAISTGFLIRLVLDHATSLDDAKRIIRGTSWSDFPTMNEMGNQVHWLIATEEGGCVCEFIDGCPVFIDAASTTSADFGNIMTNFSNYLMQRGTVTNHGTGYERYNLLRDHYAAAEGLEGAKDLARSVFCSLAYTMPLSDPYYPWTDWVCDDIPAPTALSWADEVNRTGAAWQAFESLYDHYQSIYDWHTLGYDQRGSNFRGAWYTAHTSIWNLHDKSLVLDIEEQNVFRVGVTFIGGMMPQE